MIVEREFSKPGHLVRLGVEKTATGWNVQEEVDSSIVHVEHHDDWHRVERAVWRMEIQALEDGFHACSA